MNREPWYIRYAESHKPDQIITSDDEGSPYLHRWHLIPRNRFFNIYLHHFIGSDKRMLHDHPWISLAYHLSGLFRERYKKHKDDPPRDRMIFEGMWTYRSSKFLHYLSLDNSSFQCWTLFFTGPKFKAWGFDTKDGWRPWRQVLTKHTLNERNDY